MAYLFIPVDVPHLHSKDGHVKKLITYKELEARIEYLEHLVKEYEKLKHENLMLTAKLAEENRNLDNFNKRLCELKLLGEDESREISTCVAKVEETTEKVKSLQEQLKTGEMKLEEISKEFTKAKNELDELIFRLKESLRSTEGSIEKFAAERETKMKVIDTVIQNPSTSDAGKRMPSDMVSIG